MKRMSSASTLLSREIATKAGKVARVSALAVAASVPYRLRTITYKAATAATPASAWGRSRLSGEKPNAFALAACSHRPSGGLSIEMRPVGSADRNTKLCHDSSIDFTPAE